MSKLELRPVELRHANAFVRKFHRHHGPARGHKFALSAWRDGELKGVAIVGRPVSRVRQDGRTLEVSRLCTLSGVVIDGEGKTHADGVASFLYAAAARAAFALGYRRIGTYTLKAEQGTSLKAAGWRVIAEVSGRSWDCPSRPRIDKHPTEDKLLWEPA